MQLCWPKPGAPTLRPRTRAAKGLARRISSAETVIPEFSGVGPPPPPPPPPNPPSVPGRFTKTAVSGLHGASRSPPPSVASRVPGRPARRSVTGPGSGTPPVPGPRISRAARQSAWWRAGGVGRSNPSPCVCGPTVGAPLFSIRRRSQAETGSKTWAVCGRTVGALDSAQREPHRGPGLDPPWRSSRRAAGAARKTQTREPAAPWTRACSRRGGRDGPGTDRRRMRGGNGGDPIEPGEYRFVG